MRIPALAPVLFSVILAACDGSDPCLETNVVCLERETPDNLVMRGEWTGTYHVGRHFIGDNDLRLTWNDDRYTLRVEREGIEREPLYKTHSFYGVGTLAPGQTHFRARYSTDEIWHFYGRYYNDDAQLVFKGWIETNGQTIGDFRLSRNRQCASLLRRRENVCIEDADTSNIRPVIGAVSVSPNPVTAGAQFTLEAAAEPVAEWRWEVSIVPVTDPASPFAVFELQAEKFHLATTAPAVPGGYAVRFRATGNEFTDEKEEALEVQ